jgi:hypothetical protein
MIRLWGGKTQKAQNEDLSLEDQAQKAKAWRKRRAEILSHAPTHPAKPENLTLKARYLQIVQNHPEVLEYIPSIQLLKALAKAEQFPITPSIVASIRVHGPWVSPFPKPKDDWIQKREKFAELLKLPLQAQIPAKYRNLPFGEKTLSDLGQMAGVSREQIRLVVKKYNLPRFTPNSQNRAFENWITSHRTELLTLSKEEILRKYEGNIDKQRAICILKEKGILPKEHPVHSANLLLRTSDLSAIYQTNPNPIVEARKISKIKAQPKHPDYQKWLQQEIETAKTKLEEWHRHHPKSNPPAWTIGVDWSLPIKALLKLTGRKKPTICYYRNRFRTTLSSPITP